MAENITLYERRGDVNIKYREHSHKQIEQHWHRFIEMEFLVSGSGTHRINGNSYPICKGEAHILKLTDIHEFSFEELCGLYLVQIPTDFLSKEINSVILNCEKDMIVYFDDVEFERVEGLFKILAEEIERGDAYSRELIQNTITTLCLLLFRKLQIDRKATSRKCDSRINDMIIFMQNNFQEPLTVGRIAEHFYMNSEYFSRYFKKRMGIGPKEYLNEIRMGYAKKLLCQSDMKILDICMACGYNSITTFLRDFGKKYNLTPKQMRAQSKRTEE